MCNSNWKWEKYSVIRIDMSDLFYKVKNSEKMRREDEYIRFIFMTG